MVDGYFILPSTIADYLAGVKPDGATTSRPEFREAENDVQLRIKRLLGIDGTRSADSLHRELGGVMWENCGMARSDASLRHALARIPEIRADFWQQLKVTGGHESLNQSLEKAGRVADFLEMAELLCLDAWHR